MGLGWKMVEAYCRVLLERRSVWPRVGQTCHFRVAGPPLGAVPRSMIRSRKPGGALDFTATSHPPTGH